MNWRRVKLACANRARRWSGTYSVGVGEESAVHWVHDTQLCKRLHHEVHRETDDDEAEQH